MINKLINIFTGVLEPDDRDSFKEAVRLGFPGPSEEKMKDLKFKLEKGIADPDDPTRPPVISSAFQVFECTWWSELDDATGTQVQEEYLLLL